ncbi:MAG: plasmid pRiA4b ORF-3 family protein [Tissierellia bacterium]|nr:plasmid pRiA4b ORF-3 family protein [Tissierellia bacterium]
MTAPPEDVGDLYGYYNFLDIYHNPKHPEDKELRTWAEASYFEEYDPERINFFS